MEPLQFSAEAEKDNVVSYCLYDLENGCLKDLRESMWRVVRSYVEGYIWQCDAFDLVSSNEQLPPWEGNEKTEEDSEGAEFLWGHVRYGDAVDEEWFVVSLLLKITEELPSAAVHLWDNDGQFLLIECAYALPKWIQPETSQNRVWLRKGKLHIIPRHYPSKEEVKELSMAEAVAILKGNAKTQAKESIQTKLRHRIDPFPHCASRTQHRARCYVPVKAANILLGMPSLISALVDGFVNRDASGMHALLSPCFIVPEDFVMCVVKLHRCSYAQLMQTDFHPPRGYALPDVSDPNFKAANLGMKIACGMELLCRKYLKQNFEVNDVTSKEIAKHIASVSGCSVSSEDFSVRHPLVAEDDDVWLFDGQKELERELLERQSEQEPRQPHVTASPSRTDYDPNDLVHSFTNFVENISSYEGAETPQGVTFDANRFMTELKTVLGTEFEEAFDQLQLSDTASLDADSQLFSDSDNDASSSDRPSSNEVRTATDSDDDSKFQSAYEAALQTELDQTKMHDSFVTKPASSTSNAPNDALPEVDVDVNLVESLLQSHYEQYGLPGPAGNLAGLLNLTLPPSTSSGQHQDSTQSS